MYYSGIDPSWSGKYPTVVAVSNNSLKVVQYIYTKSANDIICAIAPYNNSIIEIDALV